MAGVALGSIPIPPFPPLEIRRAANEWDVCIPSWTFICEKLLLLPAELFQDLLGHKPVPAVIQFLLSFVDNSADAQESETWTSTKETKKLANLVFLLLHRAYTTLNHCPRSLLQWTFLGHFCKVFRYHAALQRLVEKVWAKHHDALEASLQTYKDVLVGRFEKQNVSLTDDVLFANALIPLLRRCPSAGTYFLTGSDLLDSLISAYGTAFEGDRSNLLLLAFFMLLAPLQAPKTNASLLRDHLFNLRADAENAEKSQGLHSSLLSDLVTNTPFFARLRKQASTSADQSKSMTLISSIERFQSADDQRPKKLRRRTRDKGKARLPIDTADDAHVHRFTKIYQVQDLFPDLGIAYIARLLDNYGDDVEQVTAHLLEGNLPTHLSNANHSEHYAERSSARNGDLVPDLGPRSTPPPSPPASERRNVFDNDAFDRLAISETQIYRGRKDTDNVTREQDSMTRNAAKAAILSALAAFDADDDERDDTYDLEDVGGTVDKAGPDGDDNSFSNDVREKNEEMLFATWKISHAAFGRDSATRRSTARQVLKRETGMTDEAIEGWALMLQRDPGKIRKMESRYATFGGQQHELKPTAWREAPETEDEMESSGTDAPRGGFRGGARGGKGRGRGGNVAGPSDDKTTQISRDRKEAGKSSRANHNRRDQRARKMARGGGMAG